MLTTRATAPRRGDGDYPLVPPYLKDQVIRDHLRINFMIQPRSLVVIADNSGAKIGRIFKVLGSSHKRYAEIGELVTLSVQVAEPRKAS
jgi:hypothetical protein